MAKFNKKDAIAIKASKRHKIQKIFGFLLTSTNFYKFSINFYSFYDLKNVLYLKDRKTERQKDRETERQKV